MHVAKTRTHAMKSDYGLHGGNRSVEKVDEKARKGKGEFGIYLVPIRSIEHGHLPPLPL